MVNNKQNIPAIEATTLPKQGMWANSRNLCWLLAIVCLLVYGNTLVNGFVMDDETVITKNTLVKKGIESIPELMVTPRMIGLELIVNDNYRPLSLVMFAIEYQIYGANPFMGHLWNILFFAGCVVLLFLFLNRLFRGEQTAMAFLASLVFAVHPLHTEVVANIKSRDELLCFFFGFASLLVFMKYAASGRWQQLVGGTLLFTLAILSKETVISFVIVAPLVFYFYANENRRRSTHIVISTVVVAVLFVAMRSWVLRNNDSSAVPYLDNPMVGTPLFSTRIPTAILVLGMYLKLMAVPWPLICDYSFNAIPVCGFSNLWVWVSFAFYIAVVITSIYRLIKHPKDSLAFGFLFFLINLALFSNIFFLVYSQMAERLVFFASAGYCIALAVIIVMVAEKTKNLTSSGHLPAKVWLLLLPMLLIYSGITINRNADWKSNTTLHAADLPKSPNDARLWHNMGAVLALNEADSTDNAEEKKRLILDGITHVQHSLTIYRNNAKAQQDLGNFFRMAGQYDSAAVHMKEAVRLNPKSAVPVNDLGYIYFSAERYREALDLAQNALKKDPKNAGIMANIGVVYTQMKIFDSSIYYFENTLALQPDNSTALQYLPAVKRLKLADTIKGK